MRGLLVGMALSLPALAALAQVPVEDRATREQAILHGQQRTGAAYRELQQAQYESKLAEQDFLNAQEASRAAQRHADEMKRQLDAAKQALDAAKLKEARARSRYDEALTGVDGAFKKPPDKK